MVNYTELQKLVLDSLNGAIPEIPSEPYPDKPEKFELTHPEGVILVFFAGSRYSESTSKPFVMQKGRVVFKVTLCLRDLANDEKALGYVDRIQKALLGKEAANCTFYGRMQQESVDTPIYDEEDNVWIYGMSFYMPHEIKQNTDQ